MAVSQVCFVHVLTQTSLIRPPTIPGSAVKIYKPGHTNVIQITCLQKHTMETNNKRKNRRKKKEHSERWGQKEKCSNYCGGERAGDENHGNWEYIYSDFCNVKHTWIVSTLSNTSRRVTRLVEKNKERIMSGRSWDDTRVCEPSALTVQPAEFPSATFKRQITVFTASLWTFVTWNLLVGTTYEGRFTVANIYYICV